MVLILVVCLVVALLIRLHLASMAIFVGGISALAIKRKAVIAGVGFRALIAATLACLVTACVAGLFYNNNSMILLK